MFSLAKYNEYDKLKMLRNLNGNYNFRINYDILLLHITYLIGNILS